MKTFHLVTKKSRCKAKNDHTNIFLTAQNADPRTRTIPRKTIPKPWPQKYKQNRITACDSWWQWRLTRQNYYSSNRPRGSVFFSSNWEQQSHQSKLHLTKEWKVKTWKQTVCLQKKRPNIMWVAFDLRALQSVTVGSQTKTCSYREWRNLVNHRLLSF